MSAGVDLYGANVWQASSTFCIRHATADQSGSAADRTNYDIEINLVDNRRYTRRRADGVYIVSHTVGQ